MRKRLFFSITFVMQLLFVSAQSITPLSGRVGDRLTINAPSSTDYSVPDLYSVQWKIFTGDASCVSLVNATSRTVAVNLLKEGNVRIQCRCEYYSSSNPGWGKSVQNSYYDITISATGGGGGGGTGGGGGFGDDDPVTPNPTVGAGWTRYNNYYFYCAENTEEGIPMRFTQTNPDNFWCGTFSWQSGTAVCINPNTEGKVTIPAEVNGYTLYHVNNYSFYNCNKLTEVIIPHTAAYILNRAFMGCSALETITIPESIIKVDNYAFKGCTSLRTVTCLGETPPSVSIYSDPFDGLQKNMILYVPLGCKETYSKNEVWRNFKQIIEIENSYNITTSAAGYATFYSSLSAYKLPEGLSASVVTEAANDKLTYSELGGNVIPKGTAVMLTSTNKNSGTYTLKRTSINTTYSGTNLLMGSDEPTTVASSGNDYYYKLSYGKSGSNMSGVFGWYWGAANGGAFQIEANKAWLAIPKTSVGTRGFIIDGNTTGIEALSSAESEDAVYYDLQGRRIDKPAKGVYISNGKKVIIK